MIFGKSTRVLNPYIAFGITGIRILADICTNNSDEVEAENNFHMIEDFYTEVMDLYDSGFYF